MFNAQPARWNKHSRHERIGLEECRRYWEAYHQQFTFILIDNTNYHRNSLSRKHVGCLIYLSSVVVYLVVEAPPVSNVNDSYGMNLKWYICMLSFWLEMAAHVFNTRDVTNIHLDRLQELLRSVLLWGNAFEGVCSPFPKQHLNHNPSTSSNIDCLQFWELSFSPSYIYIYILYILTLNPPPTPLSLSS